MTDNNHPITPPTELVEQWRDLPEFTDGRRKMIMVTLSREKLLDIATQAARWGADQELEACINYFLEYDSSWGENSELITGLRTLRRPKPPSWKKEALVALGPEPLPEPGPTGDTILNAGAIERHRLIRRALEQLND